MNVRLTTYKLFRLKNGKLYPLYVEHQRQMPIGAWIDAHVGELVDEGHVKGRRGPLSLRPGFHSTLVPFTDWIGKKGADGRLLQRADTVWCECQVEGREQLVTERNGLKTLPSDWYRFRTNVKQKDPWIISNRILIKRVLGRDEVKSICEAHGLECQPMEKGEQDGEE